MIELHERDAQRFYENSHNLTGTDNPIYYLKLLVVVSIFVLILYYLFLQ